MSEQTQEERDRASNTDALLIRKHAERPDIVGALARYAIGSAERRSMEAEKAARAAIDRAERAEARVRQLEGDLAAERDAFGRMDVEKQNATAEIVALTAEVASLRSRLEEAERIPPCTFDHGGDAYHVLGLIQDNTWSRAKGAEVIKEILAGKGCGALPPLPAPTSAPREETAWLIERGEAFGQRPTCWWGGEGCEWGQWTPNANRAIRFTSREAAEEAIRNRYLASVAAPAPAEPERERIEGFVPNWDTVNSRGERRTRGDSAEFYYEPLNDGSHWTPATLIIHPSQPKTEGGEA